MAARALPLFFSLPWAGDLRDFGRLGPLAKNKSKSKIETQLPMLCIDGASLRGSGLDL